MCSLSLSFLTGFPVDGEGLAKKLVSGEKWETKLFELNLTPTRAIRFRLSSNSLVFHFSSDTSFFAKPSPSTGNPVRKARGATARQSVKEPIQRAFIPKVEQASLVLFFIIDHVCLIPSAKDRFLSAQPLLLPLRKPTPIWIRLRRAHS